VAKYTPHDEDGFEAVTWALSVVHGEDNASAMLAHSFRVREALRTLKRAVTMLAQATLKQRKITYNNYDVFQSEMAKIRRRVPPALHRIVLAALQCGRFAVYPDRGPVRGFDGVNVIFDGGSEPSDKVFMVLAGGAQPSKTAAGKPQPAVPQTAPAEPAEGERWPAPLATKPEKFRGKSFGNAPFLAARELYKMEQERVHWKYRADRLDKLNERRRPLTIRVRTMDKAVDYLKFHSLIAR
jgi:hypothetical protein